jgi:CheY-like chemotaxis protein
VATTQQNKMEQKQINILLADDDQDDRNFFDRALKEIPVNTHLKTVSDGEQLMNHLTENIEHLPDVLFLDINMPRKNGYECLSEIKQNKKLKHLAVFMFSTSNAPDKITQTFKAGANIYIHKPSSFDELKQVIFHSLPIAKDNTKVKYIFNAQG